MDSFLLETVYFGIVISLLSYWIAVQIRKLLPYPIFNPLLISAVISIGILIIFDIDFDTYNKGAQFITFLLTPATVCLAVPLYKQVQILIKHLDAILISLFSGCLAGIVSIFYNVFNYESRSCNLLFTFYQNQLQQQSQLVFLIN